MPTRLALLLVGFTDSHELRIEQILRGDGYAPEITRAADPDEIEALLAERASDLDLILCRHSPAHDCPERALRALDSLRADIPLLVLSESDDAEAATEAIRAGASDWIVTDHLSQRLVAAVDHALSDLRHRRRSAEVAAELEDSRERYRALAEALPQVVFELDLKGRFTFVNQRGLELFGYTQEDLAQRPSVMDLVVEGEQALHRMARVFRGETHDGGAEYTVIAKDGAHIPGLIHSAPITQGDEVVGLRGIVVDLRPIRETEQQLRASEERYRRLVETMGDGLVTIDQEGTITFANQALAEMLELPVEEVIGRDVRELVDEESAETLNHQIAERFSRGVPATYELDARTSSGRALVLLITSTSLRDEAGRTIASLAVVRDITQQRQREERRRLITARLSLLNTLNQMLNAGESIDEIIAAGADGLRDVLRAHHVHIFMLRRGEAGDEVIGRYSNMPAELESRVFGRPLEHGALVLPLEPGSPTQEMYESGEMLEVRGGDLDRSVEQIERWVGPEPTLRGMAIMRELGVGYLCMTPLLREGEPIGHVTVSRSEDEPLSGLEKDLLQAFAQQMAVILDKARSELEIARLNQFLRAIIESTAAWFSVIDEDGKLIVWNRAAAEMSGYEQDEIESADHLLWQLYPDEGAYREVQDYIRRAARGEELDEFETSIRRSDGRRRRVVWHLRRFVTPERGLGFVVTGRDITQSRELEEHLQRVQRMDAVGTLAGGSGGGACRWMSTIC